MADISDVSNAIGALLGSTFYPSGATGEQASSLVNAAVRIEAGWPSPQSLDQAMAAGKVHVSIYPRPGAERNTTRYPRDPQAQPLRPKTYTLVASGSTITVGGTAPSTYYPQNLAAFVSGKPYVVTAMAGQTAAQVAAALLALIQVDWPAATASGATITLPSPLIPGAQRVGSSAAVLREIRRQEREFQITVWAPTPDLRNSVSAAADLALAEIAFLALADGSAARLIYRGTALNDFDQKQAVWRRDLFYSAEYPTLATETDIEVVAVQQNLEDQFGAVIDPIFA